MAGNNTNVYATSQPNQFSIADTVVKQDQLNLQRQEQRRREQMFEQQKKEKEQLKKEKLRERILKVPKGYDTGSTSLNELQSRIIMQAVNRKGEIYEKLLLDKNIPDSERIKLELESQNLDMIPENLKLATNNFTKLIGDYQKGVQEDSFFRNMDFEKMAMNGFENYIGTIDENGFPLVGFKDIDDDGKIDLMPWNNLKDGIGVWDFLPKLNYDKMIGEMTKGLGTVKTKDRNGYDIITEKGIPLDLAKVSAKSMMYDPDGGLTNFAKSRLTELGYNYNNASSDVIKEIERDVTERILNSKDRESLRERDTTSEQGALNRAQRERHYQDNKNKETTGIGEAVEPTEGTWKSFYNTIPDGVKSVPISNSKTKFNSLKSKDKTYSNVTIDNYSYDKNGEILISGSYPEKQTVVGEDGFTNTTSVENKRVRMKGNKEIESRLAKMEGVTIEELRQRANFTQQNMSNDLPDIDGLPNL